MSQTRNRAITPRARVASKALSGSADAILYMRVSDKGQVENGNGLESQETTCREYADRKGYNVVAVFSDDLTGKTANREGLKSLLAFLKARRTQTVVIIDDVNRLARSLRTHFAIRDAILAAGGKLESPKRVFVDDPEDDLHEVIEAAFAGEHRRKNAEQTLSRMRARCLGGHWCLQLPYDCRYREDRSKGAGATIERHEPVATIIQEALEAYACGHLMTQAEVARFLGSHPDFPHQRSGRVPDDTAKRILTNLLYAGYVHVPRWDVSLRPGHHPALISFETFQKIQRRPQSSAKGYVRKDNSQDFALRGFVVCGCCGTRLTSCWAKGSHGRYPYYHCRERQCEAYGRSIPRAKIAHCGRLLGSFDDAFRTAMAFLANPCKLWLSERFDLRRLVLKLAFVGRLEYVRGSGFRTPLTSSPFMLFRDLKVGLENWCARNDSNVRPSDS